MIEANSSREESGVRNCKSANMDFSISTFNRGGPTWNTSSKFSRIGTSGSSTC